MRVFSILIFLTSCLFVSMSHSSEAYEQKIIYLPAVSNLPIHILGPKDASANIIGFIGGMVIRAKRCSPKTS